MDPASKKLNRYFNFTDKVEERGPTIKKDSYFVSICSTMLPELQSWKKRKTLRDQYLNQKIFAEKVCMKLTTKASELTVKQYQ